MRKKPRDYFVAFFGVKLDGLGCPLITLSFP